MRRLLHIPLLLTAAGVLLVLLGGAALVRPDLVAETIGTRPECNEDKVRALAEPLASTTALSNSTTATPSTPRWQTSTSCSWRQDRL